MVKWTFIGQKEFCPSRTLPTQTLVVVQCLHPYWFISTLVLILEVKYWKHSCLYIKHNWSIIGKIIYHRPATGLVDWSRRGRSLKGGTPCYSREAEPSFPTASNWCNTFSKSWGYEIEITFLPPLQIQGAISARNGSQTLKIPGHNAHPFTGIPSLCNCKVICIEIHRGNKNFTRLAIGLAGGRNVQRWLTIRILYFHLWTNNANRFKLLIAVPVYLITPENILEFARL